MRSRTGCQTCRQRKLKCDEEKPICGQCRRGSRECRLSDGVVFRHQQNASMNTHKKDAGESSSSLDSFYAYKDTFNKDNVWVEVPKNVTFFHITDPFNMETSPEPESLAASAGQTSPRVGGEVNNFARMPFDDGPGLEALSATATSNYDYNRPLSNPSHSPGGTLISHPSSNNLNFILNPAVPEGAIGTERSPLADPDSSLSPNSHSASGNLKPINDHEVAFLLRHFSETAGQWMDLYDQGGYFGRLVPVQALSNPLLRTSACAYAAKQLGRVRGRKAIVGGNVTQQAGMELFPKPEIVNWEYLGAKYYDEAIQLLMEELSNSRAQDMSVTPVPEQTFTPQSATQSPKNASNVPMNQRLGITRYPNTGRSDETLAAVAILCVYEFLDNANTAWSRHLSGTKSLFDMADNGGMMPVRSPTTPGSVSERVKPSRARKAAFWNFARQDFLAAFINEGQTRLNTEDLGLWRAAGLHINDQGFVMPSNTEDAQYPDRMAVMREDMIANALIWLLSKIINFTATGDSADHDFPQNPSSPNGVTGINHAVLLKRWKELETELNVWYQGLPDTFKPCAQFSPLFGKSALADPPIKQFSEIWYSIPICASAMQLYCMARIILLTNKPHESMSRQTSVAYRLQSYRSIELEVRRHSYQICGIAQGRPEGSVRIQQVQPLFVAGQCLTETWERKSVLILLRGIEADLGWATDYRVKQLLHEWKWDKG